MKNSTTIRLDPAEDGATTVTISTYSPLHDKIFHALEYVFFYLGKKCLRFKSEFCEIMPHSLAVELPSEIRLEDRRDRECVNRAEQIATALWDHYLYRCIGEDRKEYALDQIRGILCEQITGLQKNTAKKARRARAKKSASRPRKVGAA